MSWSVIFEVEEASCWLIFVNTIGSKQRYRWISGPWFVRYDFPNSKTSLKPWFFLSEFELKWTESCMRWKNRISATCSLFSVYGVYQKQKKQERFPKNWNIYVLMSFAYWNSKSKTWNEVWPNWQPRQADANDEARKRGREKHWETFPQSKYLPLCNSMMNDKFPVATWDIWKQRKSLRHHSFTQVHPKWHKWKTRKKLPGCYWRRNWV